MKFSILIILTAVFRFDLIYLDLVCLLLALFKSIRIHLGL